MLFLDVTKTKILLRQPIKKDGLVRQPIACYEIATRTYGFVMIYVGNRTINVTLVMLFLVGNNIVHNQVICTDGNLLALDVSLKKPRVTLVSIYGPRLIQIGQRFFNN